MESMPIIPLLIIACVAMFLLSIGRVEAILSLVPWIVWDEETRFRAENDPVYHAAQLKKVRVVSRRLRMQDGAVAAPYRMSLVNNAKGNLCLLLCLLALCIVMCTVFVSAGSVKFDRYYWIFIFFSVSGAVLASVAICIY